MILLNTHALVWMNQDDAALVKAARRLIQAAWDTQKLAVSAVSFWESEQLKGPRSIYLAGRNIFEYVRSSFIPYAHVHAIARLACGALNFAKVGNAPINSPAFVSAIRKS